MRSTSLAPRSLPPWLRSLKVLERLLACVFAFCLCSEISGHAQAPSRGQATGPLINAADSEMIRLDFVQMSLDQMNRKAREAERQRAQNKELVDSGAVSVLDLDAPPHAVQDFNRAVALLRAQNSKEASLCLQKAIAAYPRFVSAHILLGLAYSDRDDNAHAKSEFEMAAKLDDKFPRAFLNLGVLALSLKDFATAESQLEKAASLSQKDPKILLALAYAQNAGQHHQRALATAQRVHALDHKGMANVHYVAAEAALALEDSETMQRELAFFVSEDPTNPLAPVARRNLDVLAHNKQLATQAAGPSDSQPAMTPAASQPVQTFPNSENLQAQLSTLGDESEGTACNGCDAPAQPDPTPGRRLGPDTGSDTSLGLSSGAGGAWTIRKAVDHVALYFAVSSHGRMVSDLEPSDIQIRDDNKPPETVLQFIPQSKLALRLALVVDTSGSVKDRFPFEKRAATEFIRKVLNNASDLGFVVGFANEITVTQDFTAEPGQLANGMEKLTNGGGTRLFDAVSFACWKLAAYPEREPVARVLVVLSDGEDNSSHGSLKQTIQDAETMGVTIYTVSTKEGGDHETDADKILEVLAERSGGEAMFPGDVLTLGQSLDKLRKLIRSRYLVAYKPSDFAPDGRYRTIRIIAKKSGKRLQVHARKGYYARREASAEGAAEQEIQR